MRGDRHSSTGSFIAISTLASVQSRVPDLAFSFWIRFCFPFLDALAWAKTLEGPSPPAARPKPAVVTPLMRSRRCRPRLGLLGSFIVFSLAIQNSRPQQSRLSIQRNPRSRGPASWEGSVHRVSSRGIHRSLIRLPISHPIFP